MTSITQNQRYLPHELNKKYYTTKLYRNGYSVFFVCRRYKISKSYRRFNGTKESLIDKVIVSDKSLLYRFESSS